MGITLGVTSTFKALPSELLQQLRLASEKSRGESGYRGKSSCQSCEDTHQRRRIPGVCGWRAGGQECYLPWQRSSSFCSQDEPRPLPSSLPPRWALEPRASLANITWGCVRVGGSRQYMQRTFSCSCSLGMSGLIEISSFTSRDPGQSSSPARPI